MDKITRAICYIFVYMGIGLAFIAMTELSLKIFQYFQNNSFIYITLFFIIPTFIGLLLSIFAKVFIMINHTINKITDKDYL